MQTEHIGVGSTVWRLADSLRAVWTPYTITGETSRSWIAGEHKWAQHKIAKKRPPLFDGWALSETERDVIAWDRAHRWKVCDLLSRSGTREAVAEVARMLGYTPEPPRSPGPPQDPA